MGSERALRRLAATLAAARDVELSDLAVPQAAERLILGAQKRALRRLALRRSALPALLAALALAAFLLLRPRALSFEVGAESPGHAGAWISAEAEAVPLVFSDGSRLTLHTKARGRVLEIDRAGARFVLEQGTLSLAVVHRAAARWSVVAGPFEVQVTGTRFDVSWSLAAESFELTSLEGAVIVTGPSLGTGRALASGQSLRVALREGAGAAAAETSATPSAAPSAAELPSPAASAVTRRGRASAPKAASASGQPAQAPDTTSRELRALSAAGRYAELLEQAERQGFSELCAGASAADLLLLADAARFSGRAERAREALLALRGRFARDARARTAAFLLGRVAFERGDADAEAARWFEIYLSEEPNGSLAGDALIRLAECRRRSGDASASRDAARRYLSLYPDGPHVERARRLQR
jgi:TolA-binding protein